MRVIVEFAVLITEAAGIAAILVGAAIATFLFFRRAVAGAKLQEAYRLYRQGLGQAILLGLELLVAADIINTVALEPTLRSVAVLGGVVLIRTFLSFALEVELEGRWPWRRARADSSAPS